MRKILYFLLPILTLFVLVNNVSADTIDVRYITDYTDIKLFNSINSEYDIPKQTTNSVISGITKILITIDHSFDNDLEYEVELATPYAKLNTNINKVQALGYNITCQLTAVDLTSYGSEFPLIRFKCPATTPYIILSLENMGGNVITTADNFRWNWSYLRYIIDNSISDATQSIITNDNTNTQNIINNQNQNTQDIIDANSQNTQDIIDANSQNTQDIIDANNENFNSCNSENNYNIKNKTIGYYLNDQGDKVSSSNFSISDYIIIQSNNSYIFTYETNAINNPAICWYTNNKTLISCSSWSNTSPLTLTSPSNAYYVRVSKRTNYNSTISGEICINKLDKQTNAINDLDSTITDDNVDDNNIASSFEDFNDFLDDNSTITQLITLPITLYTAILNNINGTCSPFNLGSLFGTDLILPCINISQYLGSSLWNMIDIIISGFAIYAIAKKMIKVFNNFSSLREGDVIDD